LVVEEPTFAQAPTAKKLTSYVLTPRRKNANRFYNFFENIFCIKIKFDSSPANFSNDRQLPQCGFIWTLQANDKA
jgi:hypothetical protein